MTSFHKHLGGLLTTAQEQGVVDSDTSRASQFLGRGAGENRGPLRVTVESAWFGWNRTHDYATLSAAGELPT